MTLLEMTMVILVLMILITVLFIGARSWKRGSDRALCIIQIHNVQLAVRSYANLYGFAPGTNAPNLKAQLIGFGRFIETTPICPSGEDYTFGQTYGSNTIPPLGALYMECPLAAESDHQPHLTPDW